MTHACPNCGKLLAEDCTRGNRLSDSAVLICTKKAEGVYIGGPLVIHGCECKACHTRCSKCDANVGYHVTKPCDSCLRDPKAYVNCLFLFYAT